jgi:hypothetical protein
MSVDMAGASAASKKKQQVPHKTSVKKQGTLCDKIWAKIDNKKIPKIHRRKSIKKCIRITCRKLAAATTTTRRRW